MSCAAVPKANAEAQRAELDAGVFLVRRDDVFAFPTGVGMNRKRPAQGGFVPLGQSRALRAGHQVKFSSPQTPAHHLPASQWLEHSVAKWQGFGQGPGRPFQRHRAGVRLQAIKRRPVLTGEAFELAGCTG